MIKSFQELYWKLIELVAKNNRTSFEKQILNVSMHAAVINKTARVTGDSVSLIVEQLLKERDKLTVGEIYDVIKDFAQIQNFSPLQTPVENREVSGLVKKFFEIVKEHREGL
jgi:hypothetical protein